MKPSGDIPWVFVHLFQIVLNFLYVCQPVIWLTSLLILDKFRDISSSGCDISLDFPGDINEMFVHWIQIILNILYVCQTGSWHSF